MKRILARPPRRTGPVRFEPFLIPDTIRTPDGREFATSELMSQRRQNYHSITLKKKPRLAHHNWTPEEMQWIVNTPTALVRCRYGLEYHQALGLQWRCQRRLQDLKGPE